MLVVIHFSEVKMELKNKIDSTIGAMLNIRAGAINEKDKCPISIIDINKWEWAQGVGMYGLYRFCEASGDKARLSFLKDWYSARISEGLPEKSVNCCAPLLTLTFIHEGKQEYLDIIEEFAEWLMNDLVRTEEGGFTHSGTGVVCSGELWDDTLFMAVLFLARAGIIFDRRDWIDETKRQFLLHIKYLTELKTGLFYHGWSFNRLDHFAGALWGRGNAWLTVAIPDYIDILADKLEAPVKDVLLSSLGRQIEALANYQDESGGWHTLVNEKESYLEMSATAGFCYGILKSVRMGYVDNRYLEVGMRGLKSLTDNIDEDGVVHNVSYGTALKDNLDYYRNIRITPMTYGQALAVLAMSEGVKVD